MQFFPDIKQQVKKRILAENQVLDAVVKLGMSYEQSASKAKNVLGTQAEQRVEVNQI